MSKVVAPCAESPVRRFSVDKSEKENSPLDVNRFKSLLKSTVDINDIEKDAGCASTGAIKKNKQNVLVKLKNGTTIKLCSSCATENDDVTKKKSITKPRVATKKSADMKEKKRAPRKTKTPEVQSKTTIPKRKRQRTAINEQENAEIKKVEKLTDNAKIAETFSQGSQDVIENNQRETKHTRKPRVIKKKQVHFDEEFENENTDLSEKAINFSNVTKRRSMRNVPDPQSEPKSNDETLKKTNIESATKKMTKPRKTVKEPSKNESKPAISKLKNVSKSAKDASALPKKSRTTRQSMDHDANSESGYLTDASKSLASDSTNTTLENAHELCKTVKVPVRGESQHEISNLTNASIFTDTDSSFMTKTRTTSKSTVHDLKNQSGCLADVSKSLRSDEVVPTLTNTQELSTLQVQHQAGASTSAEALQKSEPELKSPKERPSTSKISEREAQSHSYVNLPDAECLYNSLLDNTLVQEANGGHSTSVEDDGPFNVQHPEIGSSSQNIQVAPEVENLDQAAIKSERHHAKELHVTKEEYDMLYPIYKDKLRYKLVVVDPNVQKHVSSSCEKPGTSSENANELTSNEGRENYSSSEKEHCSRKSRITKSKEKRRSERQRKTDLQVAKATAKLSKLCSKVLNQKTECGSKGKLIIPELSSSSSESYDSDSSTECDSSCSCNNSFSSGDRCSCWICKQKVVSSATSEDTDYSIESPYYGSPSESSSNDSSSSESSDSSPCSGQCKLVKKRDEKSCASRKDCKRRH